MTKKEKIIQMLTEMDAWLRFSREIRGIIDKRLKELQTEIKKLEDV